MSDFNFASKDLTVGQLNALVKMLGGDSVALDILANRVRFEITQKSILIPLQQVTIGPVDSFNPHEFFTTREGLWVSGGFNDLVLSVVGNKVSLDEEVTLSSFTITEPATNETVRENLPKNHVFKADELCTIIAHLVKRQPNGKEGPLLSNGYVNLFYVKGRGGVVYVVDIRWDVVGRGWDVFAWGLGGRRWDADHRVFSRNC